MGPVVLEHRDDEPVVLEQEDSRPTALGHKVDTLVDLGRRGFVLNALGRQDFEPVDLGQEGFGTTAARLDLDRAPARVDLVGMYTRVATTMVGFYVSRVDLAVAKFVPRLAEVGSARVWVERCAEHITSIAVWLATTVLRIDNAVVACDLAVG